MADQLIARRRAAAAVTERAREIERVRERARAEGERESRATGLMSVRPIGGSMVGAAASGKGVRAR